MALTPYYKLLLVKLLHTFIWCIFVSVIGYVMYAGIVDSIDAYAWFAIALVTLEGVVIVFNDGKCPLTPLAARYTENRHHNFDIFLPEWLARYNKQIFTTLFGVGVLLVLYRVLS